MSETSIIKVMAEQAANKLWNGAEDMVKMTVQSGYDQRTVWTFGYLHTGGQVVSLKNAVDLLKFIDYEYGRNVECIIEDRINELMEKEEGAA